MQYLIISMIALTALLLAVTAWIVIRMRRTERKLYRLLDLADELEKLLDQTQKQMNHLQTIIGRRVPSDIAEAAHASLENVIPIREAKRDVLQHRLWIQKHGINASLAELDSACQALERAKEKIAVQLGRLEKAGSELSQATEAAVAAAQREPAELRRLPSSD